MRLQPNTILAITLLALTGCQDTGITRAAFAKFAVGPAATSPVVTQSQHQGVLTVNFSSLLNSRSVLATVADVDKVVVRLFPPPGGQVLTQTVNKSALAAGTVTCTFTGLAPGDYTVEMVASDVDGNTLGRNLAPASVQAGQPTTVSMTVPLLPTLPGANPIPSNSPGSGGSGGGTAPTTGDLTASATLVDGLLFPTAVAATEEARFHRDLVGFNEIGADAQGNVYIGGVGTEHGHLIKLKPDMSIDWEAETPGLLPFPASSKAIGPAQEVWWGGLKFSSTGIHQLTLPRGAELYWNAVDVDSQGNVWLIEELHPTKRCALVKYSPDGTLLLEIDLPDTTIGTRALVIGPGDSVWCNYPTSNTSYNGSPMAVRFSADGQKVAEFPVDSYFGFAVDSQNNVWSRFTKYSANGDRLVTLGLSPDEYRMQMDAADNLWVHYFGRLLKISPTGQPLASYLVPADEKPVDYDFSGVHLLGEFRVLSQNEVAMVYNHNLPNGHATTSVLKLRL